MIPKSVLLALAVLMVLSGQMTPQMFGGFLSMLAVLP